MDQRIEYGIPELLNRETWIRKIHAPDFRRGAWMIQLHRPHIAAD
jgi:hypothetical protein